MVLAAVAVAALLLFPSVVQATPLDELVSPSMIYPRPLDNLVTVRPSLSHLIVSRNPEEGIKVGADREPSLLQRLSELAWIDLGAFSSMEEDSVERRMPLIGDVSGAFSTYRRSVDLDDLRTAAKKKGPWGDGAYERLGIEGRIDVGSQASIKVGYEIGETDRDVLAVAQGVVGADMEYRMGQRAAFRARYQWGIGDRTEPSGADVHVGYSIADDVWVEAGYSTQAADELNPESGKGGSSAGEARLVVRF